MALPAGRHIRPAGASTLRAGSGPARAEEAMTRRTFDTLNLDYSGKGRVWKDAVVIVFLAVVLGAFAFQLIRGPDTSRSQPGEMTASRIPAAIRA